MYYQVYNCIILIYQENKVGPYSTLDQLIQRNIFNEEKVTLQEYRSVCFYFFFVWRFDTSRDPITAF